MASLLLSVILFREPYDSSTYLCRSWSDLSYTDLRAHPSSPMIRPEKTRLEVSCLPSKSTIIKRSLSSPVDMIPVTNSLKSESRSSSSVLGQGKDEVAVELRSDLPKEGLRQSHKNEGDLQGIGAIFD
jgi:hypothetical protein